MTDSRGACGVRSRSGAGRWSRAFGGVLATAAFVVSAALSASASTAPHVVYGDTPEACAMCHRGHSAPGVVERAEVGSWDTTGSALVVTAPGDSGDTALCYACHGVDALGSGTNVQSAFTADSAHSLAPESSAFGPSPKQCSSCHDVHGTARTDAEEPYSGLLRSRTSDGVESYAGEEFCATCHFEAREASRFRGLEVYRESAHFTIDATSTGTAITCSICHESHGSAIAPLIRSEFTTPAAPAAATIAANDRTLCYVCHAAADDETTWSGETTYTVSSHGSTDATTAPFGEWASEESTRLAGECQSCHNPMGRERPDGEDGIIAALAEAEGRELCYRCHQEDGPASTDFKSMAVRPDLAGEEVVIAYDPPILPHAYSSLHVYTREADGAALEGPRRYVPAAPEARSGSMAVAFGGLDGLGTPELVVTDPGAPDRLHVYAYDPLAGLAATPYSLEATASLVAVGDFLFEGSGRPEVAVVSIDADGASQLRLYRLDGAGLVSVDGPFGGPFDVGYDATGIAAGDLGLGIVGAQPHLVVTARSAEGTGTVFVIGQTAIDTVSVTSFESTCDEPRGPSIGPVRAGGEPGIVIADSSAVTPSISLYAPDGSPAGKHPVYAGAGAPRAWDTLTDRFMSADATGVAVAVRNESGPSAVSIFEVGAAGVGTRADVMTGNRFATSSLAVGDVNGDGMLQLAVANAGFFSRIADESVSPSVQSLVWNAGTSTFDVDEELWAGGVELAGGTPGIVVADLGPVGRSRHPASAIPGVHVSTEGEAFERHAECVDCHNVHVADDDATAVAPAVYGVLKGSWGYDIATGTLKQGVAYEYETCFKCHGPSTWGYSPRDIVAEFDAATNGSVHPVTSDHDVTGARIYCIECHNNADATQSRGPHVSPASPLLAAPLIGARSGDAGMLCYRCHDVEIYRDGDVGSEFYDADAPGDVQLHAYHVMDHGVSCRACHEAHGSGIAHLLRPDLGWSTAAAGGSCASGCHLDAMAHEYDRTPPDLMPDDATLQLGTLVSGGVGSLAVVDQTYYVIGEAGGAQGGLTVVLGFNGVRALPFTLNIVGRYDQAGTSRPDHSISVQAYNFVSAAWDALAPAPSHMLPSAADQGYAFVASGSQYLSPAGRVEIRFNHIRTTTNPHASHRLYLDGVWLSY